MKEISLNEIMSIVCGYFKVTPEDIKRKTRKSIIIRPKHFYFFLAKKYTNCSLYVIGESTGNDHSVVIHALKSIGNSLETSAKYRDYFEHLTNRIDAYIDRHKFFNIIYTKNEKQVDAVCKILAQTKKYIIITIGDNDELCLLKKNVSKLEQIKQIKNEMDNNN